ncbi:pyrroloquinoline quinone biosynthesis protein PqqB [Saccharopolyspora taberi]|uniref:Coenzyme PQQ synthesis protein B n=1 Tax=Saccharopolyspora taberi TaxID=60895 RepID=A0ABN3VJQ2_9PSEU
MKVVLLGTAAGGGFPQWNCGCHLCGLARAGFPGVAPRTQDCVAVSGDGEHWYLLNASPDIRAQITGCPALAPGPGRWTPIRGVLLTDAELDHSLGLFMLREGAGIRVWATEPVLGALREDLPLRATLDRYHGADWCRVTPGKEFTVDDHLAVTAIPLSAKTPKYATPAEGTWVVGYRVEDLVTGGVLLYAPCLAQWPPHLDEVVAGADCALLDGTFWSAGEMRSATGTRTQKRMGHLPISGGGGSLERLAAHRGVRRVYTHLNNTNPLLDITTPERTELVAAGVEVLLDGAELDL